MRGGVGAYLRHRSYMYMYNLNCFLALAVELQRHAYVAGACGAGILNEQCIQ